MKYLFIGVIISIAFLFLFGSVTALIPNPLFKRMSNPTTFDYVYLILTSVLLGAIISVHFYGKQKSSGKEGCSITGGTIASLLSFSCPACNSLLVYLLGATTALAFFEPLQPIFGIVGIIILGFILYIKVHRISKLRRIKV